MKKIIIGLMIVAGVLTGCAKNADKKKAIDIGITQIVEYVALDQNREGFIKALEENGYKDGENIKIDYQNAQGDIAVSQTIAKKFASENKDLIFAIGTPSAQGAYNATKKIPIMISSITDPVKAGLVKYLDESGTNVAGTSDYLPIEKQVDLIKKLVPKAKKIGVIYNTSEVNSEVQLNELKKVAKDYEIIASGVTSTNEVNSAISSLVKKIDVLYVPTDQLVVSSMPIIAKHTLEAKVPVVAAEKGSVEAGALATVGINYYKLGYETGKMAVSVLKGEDISKMPVKISNETDVYINEDSLKALNIKKPDLKNVKYIKTK
ncbi:putative ABC transport system substrate-binding protein [Clostridium tetanomorphum]|uniref:ABC transporter substrate-binding protein n=1 Tax=Clostridium tetanomorphum TaxID=1553 RepID=A0A923EBH7_CLOTT|nr:ABC transporter substrate-binding protein [Clostridium tetanomorphum]KAJ52369.1 ABC transporter substrate-binding protein [Clostridium tetanomorphum DSM 665]MBC2397889.1 ABC transporter substrate-binding protein [Clostridium tetanomorphum]MBP1864795.1 putative ABC transport system substrate-binding protein [Clostridium tetanomorphum]NRS83971.1 putative ABC transport system substrate-binding protein [Clostridium tetanomorphum]NRZ97190.1 putative ABC transport system substrate-binding protein